MRFALPFIAAVLLPLTVQAGELPATATPAEQAMLQAWNGLRQAQQSTDDQAAFVQKAFVDLFNEYQKQRAADADKDAYWKAWCGARPGCATPAETVGK